MIPNLPRTSPTAARQRSLEAAKWALQQWADFPASSTTRPIVLTGPSVIVDGRFASAQAKKAFLCGQISAASHVSKKVIAALRKDHFCQPPLQPRYQVGVTDAVSGDATFNTDRGPTQLPAWIIHSPDIIGAVLLLDPTVAEQRWTPPDPPAAPPPPGARSRHYALGYLEADGLTLRFRFSGLPAASYTYTTEVLENRAAAVVVPVEEAIEGSGWTGWAPLILEVRTVIVRLAKPLRQRVLVDFDASPISGRRSWCRHMS